MKGKFDKIIIDSRLRMLDDWSQCEQKRWFRLRKPSFYPLNYGDAKRKDGIDHYSPRKE